jgi:hypothetical protein
MQELPELNHPSRQLLPLFSMAPRVLLLFAS